MTETIPFRCYNGDATFDKESTHLFCPTVSEKWKGSNESESFDYQFQSGDTTYDDIKTVVRRGHSKFSIHRRDASNKSYPNSNSQTEQENEYDPMGPILNVLPELSQTVNIPKHPIIHYVIDEKNMKCPTKSLHSDRTTVLNKVKDLSEHFTGEEENDQSVHPPILSRTNGQVAMHEKSNALQLTIADWDRDAIHGPMLCSSDLNLYTRRHIYEELDPYPQMYNNQVTRPHSYHGPEISRNSSSALSKIVGSDQRKGYVRISRSRNLSGEFTNLTSSNKSLTSSKVSVTSSKLDTPEDGHLINQDQESQIKCSLHVCVTVTFTIISILLFFVDWATDIALARMYLIDKDTNCFVLTVAFIIGPALVCAAVDLYWFYHDHLKNVSDRCSQSAMQSEVQNTNENNIRHESRFSVKCNLTGYAEKVTGSGYSRKEMLTNTCCKSQNLAQDTYHKSKQNVLQKLTQNMSKTVQDNTQNFLLRFTRRKSQISTTKKSGDSEVDKSSSSSQMLEKCKQNTTPILSNISYGCTNLNHEEDQHFLKKLSSEKLNNNIKDKLINSQDIYIRSYETSVHSQHQPINLHKYTDSQDKTLECPEIRCQMKLHTSNFKTRQHSACVCNGNVWKGFRVFVGVLSFGRVFRSCQYIYHVIKSHQNGPLAKYHHLRALEEKRDYKLLDLIYASTESAPQFFLQLYLVFISNKPIMTIKVLSLVASVAGISWTVVSSYTHNKAALPGGRRLTLMSQVLIFLARLCEISARIISIALFEKFFKFYSLVLIIHYIIMLLWIQKQKPSLEGVAYSKHFRILFKLFFSYVLVICFINLKCNRSKYRMFFYYLLTYGENFAFAGLVLWKVQKGEEKEQCSTYWLAIIPIGFVLHVIFQILFYSCCYRNRRS